MKKKIFVMISASVLLFSGCSSNQAMTTSTVTEVTTAATTTEATTTTTSAVETTTTETTAEPEKPEKYADIHYCNKDESETANASDFVFVDAELFKDDNGELKYPSFQPGKDIVIKFKSDKELKYGCITQYTNVNDAKKYKAEAIVYADSSTKDNKNDILKMLTYEDGIYTLKIPAKYAKKGSELGVQLYTVFPVRDKKDNIVGEGFNFYIRCDKEM